MTPPSKRSCCKATVSVRVFRVSSSTDQQRIGGAQPEVRVGDVGGDRDAHGLAEVLRGDEIVRRGERPAAILAPDVELVRHLDADAVVVGRRRCRESGRLRRALRLARARRAAAQVDARIEVRLRRAASSARAASMRASAPRRSRLLANASSISAVSTGSSNAVHQRSRSALSAAVAVDAGRSSCGGFGCVTAQPASATASASAMNSRRAPALTHVRLHGRNGAKSTLGGRRMRRMAVMQRLGMRRMAGRRDRLARMQRVRVIDLRVQLVLAARLA